MFKLNAPLVLAATLSVLLLQPSYAATETDKVLTTTKKIIVSPLKKPRLVTYRVFGKRYTVLPNSTNYLKKGIASWYGGSFHGRHTSSGEHYNMYAMTAAHKTLPLSTMVVVTNLKISNATDHIHNIIIQI